MNMLVKSTSDREATGGLAINAKDLRRHFVKSRGPFKEPAVLRAVDGVSLHLEKGRVVSIVGESGSGKTTLARMLVGLDKPTSGELAVMGSSVDDWRKADPTALASQVQMIFQDPFASLNPRMSVRQILEEPFHISRAKIDRSRVALDARLSRLLQDVGLSVEALGRYPHQFSGGQRQRIAIARALALDPAVLVCDEPVAALDVSVRAQIINLLKSLQERLNISIVLIAHDLSVVEIVSDDVMIMYIGKVMEVGPVERIYSAPAHPYTASLLASVPQLRLGARDAQKPKMRLTGELPSPLSPPSGCRFRTRCWKAQPLCAEVEPPLVPMGSGVSAACHFPENGQENGHG